MHNYSSAKELLESVRHARIEQDRLRARIAEMETRCTKITASMTGMPGGGNADAQRQWAALADERARLTALLTQELQAAREVEAFINRLKTPIHRDVLALRYVNQMSVPQIRDQLEHSGYCRSQRHIERLLYWALLEAETQFIRETYVNQKGDYTHGNDEPEDQTRDS